jgi:hypothetical protein
VPILRHMVKPFSENEITQTMSSGWCGVKGLHSPQPLFSSSPGTGLLEPCLRDALGAYGEVLEFFVGRQRGGPVLKARGGVW